MRNIREEGGDYIIDDAFRCRYLIGAGGTRCPVYRTLFRELNPRASELQTVTLEHEIEYDWREPDCHLWFFDHGLPGYAWYVPKQNGWLNVGIGGMADRIKAGNRSIHDHWELFTRMLGTQARQGGPLRARRLQLLPARPGGCRLAAAMPSSSVTPPASRPAIWPRA